MVELKFKDVKSMAYVVAALRKNGYKCSTFVVWTKDRSDVDFFTIQILNENDVDRNETAKLENISKKKTV